MLVTRRAMLGLAGAVAVGVPGRLALGLAGPGPPPATDPDAGDMAAVAGANRRFGFDLYGQLRTTGGNLFFSPCSISIALAMTFAGARGETAAQMASALRLPMQDERLHRAGARVLRDLAGPGAGRRNALHVVNALWPHIDLQLESEFDRVTRRLYGAGLARVDFRAPEAARATINAWVEEQTRQRIADLLPEGSITSYTRLVLTSAIYFKGRWRAAFSEALTRPAPFTDAAGRTADVPLMHQRGTFRYVESAMVQGLELPYAGDAISMLVLLPRRADGLPALERALSAARVTEWTAALTPREVEVALPRFTMTSRFALKPALGHLGMPLAFSDRADFSGMAAAPPLKVDDVYHQAFVEVNESGTEAAAATGVVVSTRSFRPPAPVFRADHPFVVLIRDHRTDSLLFAGRLAQPRA
jgi:serpin B